MFFLSVKCIVFRILLFASHPHDPSNFQDIVDLLLQFSDLQLPNNRVCTNYKKKGPEGRVTITSYRAIQMYALD